MLCFKIFSSFFQSSVMQSFRSSVQLSNIVVSTLYDLLFKFLRSLMLGRSCLRFATMAAATLEGVLFSFLTVLRLLLPKSKIKPQYMLSLFFSCLFPIFCFIWHQVISAHLTSPCLISAHFMWEMCCGKDAADDILCKQQCTYPFEI